MCNRAYVSQRGGWCCARCVVGVPASRLREPGGACGCEAHGVSCLLPWLTMLGVVQRLVAALEAADAELENSHSKRVVKFIQ